MSQRRWARPRGAATVVALVVMAALSACGSADGETDQVALGAHDRQHPVKAQESATVTLGHGDRLRIAVRSRHVVVVQHYDHDDERWTGPHRLVDVSDRECGDVEAASAQGTVAITLECDQDYAVDQAPTDSLAVVSKDLVHWTSHDLRGEATGLPGVSPNGQNAIWSQQRGVLLWSTDHPWVPRSTGDVDGVTVTDDGLPVTAAVRNCDIKITGPTGGRVPISHPGRDEGRYCAFNLNQLWFENPDMLRVYVDGAYAGTKLVIRREGDRWRLTSARNG